MILSPFDLFSLCAGLVSMAVGLIYLIESRKR